MDLPLSNGHTAQIDPDDWDRVSQHTWRRMPTNRPGLFYAVAALPRTFDGAPRKTLRLHRFILGLQPGDPDVDHVDHDGLNNQKSNLRLATPSQNGANRRAHRTYAGKPKTSSYRGVSWNARDRKWQGIICVRGKQKALGQFDDPADAARAYDDAAVAAWGEFARRNFDGS
jgi:hypothetical protein